MEPGPGTPLWLEEAAMGQAKSLQAYARAWEQSDESKIRSSIEECWTETSTYVNPFTDAVRGVDRLVELILDYPVLFPDPVVQPSGEPQSRPECTHYPWRLTSTARIRVLGRDYGHALEGTDLIEFDDQNKIRTVVSFFGKAPV
jgi:hypothetical protein